MSGKFGLASGKSQGNVREFCFAKSVWTLQYRDALTEYIKGQVKDLIKKYSHIDELDELEV